KGGLRSPGARSGHSCLPGRPRLRRLSAARNHPSEPSGVTRSDYLAPSRLMFVHCTNMTMRHLGGLTAAVLAGALLAVAPLGSQALAGGTGAGTGGGRQDPQAMA